jgi:hypothetical protein
LFLQITCADIKYTPHGSQGFSSAENGSVIAAIAITGVAAGCFLLLIILMVSFASYATGSTRPSSQLPTFASSAHIIPLVLPQLVMRKRSKRYSYGQRCTPVSLDAYSLDSVSVFNSVRRKAGALRASKRSYGNPNFEDGVRNLNGICWK